MSGDIIERAEALLQTQRLQSHMYAGAAAMLSGLVDELKAARAENEQLRTALGEENLIAWLESRAKRLHGEAT